MATSPSDIPALRRVDATGRAVVHLDGQDHDCGPHGAPEALAEYDRLLTLWLANGRTMPKGAANTLTIDQLADAYWARAERAHSPSELRSLRMALRPLWAHCGNLPAAQFGAHALVGLRETICRTPTRRGKMPTRGTVNACVRRIKATFRWAAEDGLVPASAWHAVASVRPLRVGEGEVPENALREPEAMLAAPVVQGDARQGGASALRYEGGWLLDSGSPQPVGFDSLLGRRMKCADGRFWLWPCSW